MSTTIDSGDGSTGSGAATDHGGGTAALTAVIFEEEEARQREQQQRAEGNVLPDDLLPGVGGRTMRARDAVRASGWAMLVLLFLVRMVEEFDRVALQVLAPDIQKTLGVKDTLLAGLASFGGVVLVLSTLPFAALADRFKRTRVLSGALVLWGGFVALTGAAANSFVMGIARGGAGLGESAKVPINPSLITDAYPIEARARMLAFETLGRPAGQVVGPFLAGSIADAVGGTEGWRWAFILITIPAVLLALALLKLRDPNRGAFEQKAVYGSEVETIEAEPPVRLSAAFQRLKKVKTFYFLVVGIGVLGFALTSVPLLISLLLRDTYGYSAFKRGWIISVAWSGALVTIPLFGIYFDRLFRRDPRLAPRVAGALILGYGLFITVGLRFQNAAVLIGFYVLANACQGAAFTAVGPTISAVVPYRMRAQAFSLVGVYIFLMGGFFGGLMAGAFADAWGRRAALTIVVPPAALLGGVLIMYGSRYMKRDISLVVEELLEDQEERRRMLADPTHTPVLQAHNLDASYGPLQVLFDVSFDVQRGEVLALLGTNGAGKSTLLRTVGGLMLPDRGVVRLNGRTITLVDPESRARMGMVQVPGGEALFTGLSVRENLDVWGGQIDDPAKRAQGLERALDTFPIIRDRLNDRAGSLSGGQQQMLALAKAIMLEPEILLIDELSLGLAPVIVQDLLAVVQKLKDQGLTMIIVEQSVNVALAVADRAIFMERGRVRFEGRATELLERDDLLRAVFLSGEGA